MANQLEQFGPLDAINYVQQQGEIGRARGQQNRLAELASQSYTTPADQQNQLLGQMASISPQAAQATQQQFQGQQQFGQEQEDRRLQKLAGAARYLEQARQTKNPQAVQGAWNAVRPMLTREIPEGQFPEQWDDTTMTPVLHQVLAQTGGGALGQVQSTYVDAQGNRVAIMRNGGTQILGQDQPKVQIIDSGDGFYGVNKGTLQAAPVNTSQGGTAGAAAAGAVGGTASSGNRAADFTGLAMEFPGVQMTSGTRTAQRNAEVGGQPSSQHLAGTAADYAVPAALKPAFIARARQLGYQPIDEGDHVHLQLPNGGAAGGGSQLRKVPDAITPYQQAQLNLAQQQLEDSRAQRQAELDRKTNPAPRDLAEGEMSLRKEFQTQTKNSNIVLNSYSQIKQAATNPSAQNDLAMIFGYMRMLDPTSVVREGEFATAQNAAGVPDRVRNYYNRALNGERLNPDQRQGFVKSAEGIAGIAQQQVEQAQTEYSGLAQSYGFDPTRIVGGKPSAPAGNPAPAAPATAAGGGVDDLLSKYGIR